MSARKRCAFGGLLIASGLMAGTAQAAPVYVDFSDSSSAETLTPDSAGRYWNTLGTPGTGLVLDNAVDGSGTATAIDLTVLTPFSGKIGSGTTASEATDFSPAVTGDSWHTDYYTVSGLEQEASIKISGLTSEAPYTLAFYGANNDDSFRGLSIRIASDIQGGNFDDSAFGSEGKGEVYLEFANVAADANGEITFVVHRPDGQSRQYLGALVITPVPEPAALGALALGGLAVVRRRRS